LALGEPRANHKGNATSQKKKKKQSERLIGMDGGKGVEGRPKTVLGKTGRGCDQLRTKEGRKGKRSFKNKRKIRCPLRHRRGKGGGQCSGGLISTKKMSHRLQEKCPAIKGALARAGKGREK